MRAEIKGLHSTRIQDLESYVPPDEAAFHVPVTLVAGPKGEAGEETFELQVCSPAWLARQLEENEPMLIRHTLLLNKWDFAKVRQFVERYVNGIEADTWNEIGNKLGRLGYWEFEDYRPG